MTKASEVHISSTDNAEIRHCQRVWSAVGRFLAKIGHDRLPQFVKIAMSVAEPAGWISLRNQPDQISVKECGVLTVLSANLWHDWPRYKNLEMRLESFARLVQSESVDLLLLQEVARTRFLHADQWLAQRLQMAYVYSRANGSEKIGFEEGLGVFSRFPLKRLPHLRHMGSKCNPFVRRLALGVEVDTPCGEILAFSTHLALPRRQNDRQLRELHQWISQMAENRSVIIGGDFNAPEHTGQIKHVRSYWQDTYREIHQHGHAATHELRWPWGGVILSHRLDYIFLQPGYPAWQVVDVHHADAPGGPHSDHRAVLVRLAPLHKGD